IFCLSYRQKTAPVLYEDGMSVRDYVSIDDVVEANLLVLGEDRAVGKVLNVGGGAGITTAEFAEIVRNAYGSPLRAQVNGEFRFGDTRHILSDVDAIKQLGWTPRLTPAE